MGMGCGHVALGRSEIEREAKLQSQAVIMMLPLEHASRLILWVIKLPPLLRFLLRKNPVYLGKTRQTDRQVAIIIYTSP